MYYLKWIVPITLLYIGLTNNLQLSNWLLGVALAILITVLIQPAPSTLKWAKIPSALAGTILFVLTLFWELLISSLQVSKIVLSKEMPLRQGIYALPSGSDSDWVTVLSAHAITLTPGEMVVEIDQQGTLYTHSLDIVNSEQNGPRSQEQRVKYLKRVFT